MTTADYAGRMQNDTITPDGPVTASPTESVHADGHELVTEELLVEEISIDGMCGVY